MKRKYLVLLFIGCSFPLPADETTIILESKSPVPIYLIKSLLIDPFSETLVNDFDIYYKTMELMAISPARITVENGDYLFAISEGRYNKIIPVKAECAIFRLCYSGRYGRTYWSIAFCR